MWALMFLCFLTLKERAAVRAWGGENELIYGIIGIWMPDQVRHDERRGCQGNASYFAIPGLRTVPRSTMRGGVNTVLFRDAELGLSST
jgi:hypothetical protein